MRTVSSPGGKRHSSVPPAITPSKRRKTGDLQRHPSQGVVPLTPPGQSKPKRPVATPTPVKGTASKTLHEGQEESPSVPADNDEPEVQQPPVKKRPSVTITRIPLRPSSQATTVQPAAPSTSTAPPKQEAKKKRPATITPIPPPASSATKEPEAAPAEKKTTTEQTASQSTKDPGKKGGKVPSWIFEKQDEWARDWLPSQTNTLPEKENDEIEIPDDEDDRFFVDYKTTADDVASRRGRGSRVTFDSQAKTSSGGRKNLQPDLDDYDIFDSRPQVCC